MVESLPKPKKFSQDRIPEAQPVRLQPEGLRMRYKPFGAVGDEEDEVMADAMDVDEGHEAEKPEKPHVEESPERKKKRHKSEKDGEKKKKKKHRESEA
jgi:hypothetical protein